MKLSAKLVIALYIVVGIINFLSGICNKEFSNLIIGLQFFLLAFTTWSYENIISFKEETIANMIKEAMENDDL